MGPIVYWMYRVTTTLIVLGGFGAGRSGAREDRPARGVLLNGAIGA